MPCMEYEAITNFDLAFCKKKYISGNKNISVVAKN